MSFRALAAGLLLLTARSFPQEADPEEPAAGVTPRAVAFIVPRPQGGEQDAPFLWLLAVAMQIELAGHGLEAGMPEEQSLPEFAVAPLGRLLEAAAGADFLVLEGYTSAGQAIRMEVEVLRVRDGERLASASTSRRIDLLLDEAVGSVVEQLLKQLEPHLAEAASRRQQAAAAVLPPGENPAGAPSRPEPLPAGEPPAVPGRPPDRRLEFGAGGAVFFPMAVIDPLFRMGYLAEVYLDYRLRSTAASLAFGAYTGYAGLLPAEAGTATFFDSLIPVGLGLRLGTPERSRLGVHVRVQAGAVLNVSAQDKVDRRLTRVLPQAKAGAGVSLAITPRLGVSLEFLYELLLYMYMRDGALVAEPIMGFNVPSFFLYTRW